MTYGILSDLRFECKYMIELCMYITFYIRSVHTRDSSKCNNCQVLFYYIVRVYM